MLQNVQLSGSTLPYKRVPWATISCNEYIGEETTGTGKTYGKGRCTSTSWRNENLWGAERLRAVILKLQGMARVNALPPGDMRTSWCWRFEQSATALYVQTLFYQICAWRAKRWMMFSKTLVTCVMRKSLISWTFYGTILASSWAYTPKHTTSSHWNVMATHFTMVLIQWRFLFFCFNL